MLQTLKASTLGLRFGRCWYHSLRYVVSDIVSLPHLADGNTPQLAAFPKHGSSTTPDRLSPGRLSLRYGQLSFCTYEGLFNGHIDSSNLSALLSGCLPLQRFAWPLYFSTCTSSLHAASALSVSALLSSTFSSSRQPSWQSVSSVDHYPTAGT